jgi:anti-sigma regulatory factor (Ser/Thr protein kinase)
MPERPIVSPHLLRREFPRRIDAVPAVLGFVDEISRTWRITAGAAGDLKVALDELFTNMVKYQPDNTHGITIEAGTQGRTLLIRLTERTSEPYDLTQRPDPDLTVPLEEREPRGLGIYFVKQLMDDVRFDYNPARREGTITLTKRLEVSDVSDPEG